MDPQIPHLQCISVVDKVVHSKNHGKKTMNYSFSTIDMMQDIQNYTGLRLYKKCTKSMTATSAWVDQICTQL